VIVGDHIVTTHVLRDGVPTRVEVWRLEKHDLLWTIDSRVCVQHPWHVGHVIDAYIDLRGVIVGRLRKRDRGVTWAPAWLDDEVARLDVVAALGGPL
jgi:hypothetical protein